MYVCMYVCLYVCVCVVLGYTCIILVLEYTYLILVLGYTYVIPVLGYTYIILVLGYTYIILVLGYTCIILVLGYTYIILVLGYTCIIVVWCSASWELVQRKVPAFVRVSARVVSPKGDQMYSLHGVFCSFLFRSVCGLEKNVLTEIMQSLSLGWVESSKWIIIIYSRIGRLVG